MATAERDQVDERIREGFLPHLYGSGEQRCKQVSLQEILRARRGGEAASNNETGNRRDSTKHLQGVLNQAAHDDDTEFSQTSG